MKTPEILAPAGNFEMLHAAINAGADAVYLGIKGLNMRELGSNNFKLEDLKKVVSICHAKKVKAYLAVNTIVYENEGLLVENILKAAKQAGIDAIIAWDLMVIQKAVDLKLETHLSTQASVSNFEALRFYNELGIKRFVLARELDLEQIKTIMARIMKEKLDAEIEVFIHGAMCVAVSGRCFMSQMTKCKSANRGECIQVCRRKYKVIDEEEGTELVLENHYVMSPKDLCVMPIIDKLLDAKIDAFKIEGRARSPEYVKVVVESYNQAIDAWKKKRLTEKLKKNLVEKMATVYNKGFETGFYLGKPMDAWAGVYGSKATMRKVKLGVVVNYYSKTGIVEIKLESGEISVHDQYYIIGPTTGVVEQKMPKFMLDEKFVKNAKKGSIITFKAPKVRKKDVFYKVVSVDGRDDLVQRY